jgi:tetrapyrrole methylase family protein/MazG family protein
VVLASALDRHSFNTLRPVLLVLDAEPDMALLRTRYGPDVTLETIGLRYAALPALDPVVDLSSVAAVTRIAERLRAPDGCPWDREQTHASLRPHLLEEAYEALEALDSGDLDRLRDELGDLLFQIAIHAQLAHEEGAFDMSDVARRIGEKLVRRHPHVFGGTEIRGDLLAQWERIKREEREAGGKSDESIVSGVPKDLPALFAAERLQERAARVGLEPARIDLPLDVDDPAFLGELLFDLVAVAREKGFDAETALREANARFSARVGRVEQRARADGRALESYAPDEMRRMWESTA